MAQVKEKQNGAWEAADIISPVQILPGTKCSGRYEGAGQITAARYPHL